MAYDKGCELIRNWKENTVYISLMQLTLLIVNFFLITIISRVYGAEIYGEYASAKSLSVLIGTAIVLSLALVVTKARAQNIEYSKQIFYNSYYLVIRNLLLSLFLLIPLTIIFGRDYRMTSLFLVGFVFNEMIHIALAYYQAQGNFVITSKQIILRTILYGLGAWVIVSQGFSIIWVIVYQAVVLYIFFIVAHLYIPKNELNNNTNKETNISPARPLTKKNIIGMEKEKIKTFLNLVLIAVTSSLFFAFDNSGNIISKLAASN